MWKCKPTYTADFVMGGGLSFLPSLPPPLSSRVERWAGLWRHSCFSCHTCFPSPRQPAGFKASTPDCCSHSATSRVRGCLKSPSADPMPLWGKLSSASTSETPTCLPSLHHTHLSPLMTRWKEQSRTLILIPLNYQTSLITLSCGD